MGGRAGAGVVDWLEARIDGLVVDRAVDRAVERAVDPAVDRAVERGARVPALRAGGLPGVSWYLPLGGFPFGPVGFTRGASPQRLSKS